jgi:hypothetical protein
MNLRDCLSIYVAPNVIDDVEFCAVDRYRLSLRGIIALQDKDTGLCDQREHRQRHYHND